MNVGLCYKIKNATNEIQYSLNVDEKVLWFVIAGFRDAAAEEMNSGEYKAALKHLSCAEKLVDITEEEE